MSTNSRVFHSKNFFKIWTSHIIKCMQQHSLNSQTTFAFQKIQFTSKNPYDNPFPKKKKLFVWFVLPNEFITNDNIFQSIKTTCDFGLFVVVLNAKQKVFFYSDSQIFLGKNERETFWEGKNQFEEKYFGKVHQSDFRCVCSRRESVFLMESMVVLGVWKGKSSLPFTNTRRTENSLSGTFDCVGDSLIVCMCRREENCIFRQIINETKLMTQWKCYWKRRRVE